MTDYELDRRAPQTPEWLAWNLTTGFAMFGLWTFSIMVLACISPNAAVALAAAPIWLSVVLVVGSFDLAKAAIVWMFT